MPPQTFHFISGLPRAGTTLLAALLRQNPRFHAGMTSPAVLDLFPRSKVIACVRNVAWVMDSIERLYRANPYENTKLFHDDSERNNVIRIKNNA